MRQLTNDVYSTYYIDSTDERVVYDRLARFVRDNPNCSIEGLNPGWFSEDGESLYTLIITVAGHPK